MRSIWSILKSSTCCRPTLHGRSPKSPTKSILSQNACWRRIKRLEEEGVIVKRVALLDPEKLGVGVTVFVSVRAGEHLEKWLETFASAVRKMPEVVEFYRMTGDVDYLLKLQVANIAAYDRVYKSLIKAAPITDVSAAFAMEELKRSTALPLAP